MYKELKKIEKIDFDCIGNTRAPVFGFTFKKYNVKNIHNAYSYIINNYGYNDFGVSYEVDYEGRKHRTIGENYILGHEGKKLVSNEKINLQTYTGVLFNSKYLKLGYIVENIRTDLPIYKTTTHNTYFHLFDKELTSNEVFQFCIDTMNYETGLQIFLIFITEDFIMLPYIDGGFNFIDISGKNGNISKDILNYVDSNFDVKIGGNDLFVDYCKEYSIKYTNKKT